MKNNLTSLSLAAIISLSAAPAALAQVDEDMLARLKAFAAEQGTPLAWEGTEEYTGDDGREVTALINASFGSGDERFVIQTLELVDVTEEDGALRIGSLRIPHQRNEEDGGSFEISDFVIEGMVLPAADDLESTWMYDSLSLRELRTGVNGTEAFTMNDLHVEITPPEDGSPMEFTGAAEAFRVNLEAVEDPASRALFKAMGYESLEGYFEMAGSWNPEDGMASLSQYDITVTNAGTLGISMELGGYTRDFLAALRQIQAQAAANPGADDSAQTMAMMGLLQQLTFHSARIEFLDDSLTQKALAYVAGEQGSKPGDIANQAKAMVPFLMMQLNDPELTQQATAAVAAFLDNPRSLAITAEPATPVPFALIMAGAMSAPQALPKQLGMKVVANE